MAREAIAIARRLGDDAALLDTLVRRPRRADGHRRLDREPRAQPRGRAAGVGAPNDRERLLRTHLRLAVCHLGLGETEECDARLAAFEALAAELRAPWYGWWAGMLHAVRATMEGRFADAERLAAAARDAGGAAGHEAVERIWISNRESRLRAADRHEEMLAWEPEGRRSRGVIHIAAAWQAMGSALTYARLEQPAEARLHVELLPESFRPPDGNVFALFFVGEAVAMVGMPDLARKLYEQIRPLAGECVMLGLSYVGWEGPWARVLGLLAASLERWDEAGAHFEDAIARCRRLGARPYLARTEYEYGRMLIARGGAERARAR